MTRKLILILTFIIPVLAFIFLRIFTKADFTFILPGVFGTFGVMLVTYWLFFRKTKEL
ncbi:MAG: hypothetical protein GTN76_05090 [Candidatus Aenigmarchaeota archaeon]|nr:hypothetical protein [Candidatus Aenigmarchaeota archaeon]